MELGPVGQIVTRLAPSNVEIERGYIDDYRREANVLFSADVKVERVRRGFWVPGNIRKGKPRTGNVFPDHQQVELVLNEAQQPYLTGNKRSRKLASKHHEV
jgi:hypothetical protein